MLIRIVGDGDRDESILPHIVRGILNRPVESQFQVWPRLHRGSYERKLRFAVLEAKEDRAEGLVAVVDADRDGKTRLASLRTSRTHQRHAAESLPIAVGMADPHLEVWLLDDSLAVRDGLTLPATQRIPNVRDVEVPKDVLTSMIHASPMSARGDRECLGSIASRVLISRCAHAGETGLGSFEKDVKSEFRVVKP